MKRKAKKNKTKQKVTTPTSDRHVGNPSATDHSAESVDFPSKTPHKLNLPCRICKGYHLLKYWHGMSHVLGVWSETFQCLISSISSDHTDDTLSTNDYVVKFERLDILSCYARTCTLLNFVLAWMNFKSSWNILLFLTNSFQHVIVSFPLTSHWLIKWSVQFHPRSIPLFLWRVKNR